MIIQPTKSKFSDTWAEENQNKQLYCIAIKIENVPRRPKSFCGTFLLKYLSRIYLLSLFQNDRGLLYVRHNIKLVHLDFHQDFFVMLFTEYLRFTAMTNNKDCTVFSLIARSLFMTTRAYERNRVRTRLQNSTSFPHDTQRVIFNPLH